MFIYLLLLCVFDVMCDDDLKSLKEFYDNNVSDDSKEVITTNCKANILNEILSKAASSETNEESINEESNSTINASGRRYQETSNVQESSENKSSNVNDFPYTVSIKRKAAHYATGALVDKSWVLTVAREFYLARESMKLFQVVLGSVDCKRGGVLNAIKVIEVHPKYRFGKPSYDIALLKLAWSVTSSDLIKPIRLSRVDAKVVSAKFQTTYWPRVVVNNTVLPAAARERVRHSSMRVSTQSLIPREQCVEDMEEIGETLDNSSLCLNPIVMYHTACMPDPGAPVVGTDGLWGITSGWTSAQCREVQSPTIFTKVAAPAVRDWIANFILVY